MHCASARLATKLVLAQAHPNETSLDTYNKLLHDNITKTYKPGSEDNISEKKGEINHIANKLSIGQRIECMKKREAFISLKDHKENFENNPKCRLINPAKSDSRKISKSILDKINTKLRPILNANQCTVTPTIPAFIKHSFVIVGYNVQTSTFLLIHLVFG